MGHYWLATEPEPVRRAQLEDWLDDLGEFESHVVAEACRQWRRTGSRRPLPSDIRRFCVELQRQDQERAAIAGPSDLDGYARSVGFRDNAERMAEIRRVQAKRNDPGNAERLRRIRDEMSLRPVGQLRAAGDAAPEISKEALRRARIAIGLEPQQQAAE